jgi:hypothetical protein
MTAGRLVSSLSVSFSGSQARIQVPGLGRIQVHGHDCRQVSGLICKYFYELVYRQACEQASGHARWQALMFAGSDSGSQDSMQARRHICGLVCS